MILLERREATRTHRCDRCGRPIRPGEAFLRHSLTPGHVDAETAEVLGEHWLHKLECADCAVRGGRELEVSPIVPPEPTQPLALFGEDQ